MERDLSDYRKNYQKGELDEKKVSKNPFLQFQNWFEELEASKSVVEANAMNLSTIGLDGFPRGRIVLMKHFSEEGLIFYTNYKSAKGRSIEKISKVCASFYWPALERQVIIKGEVEKIDFEKSQEYFRIRPRKSQLGAAVSNQSEVVPSREVLEQEMKDLEERYNEGEVPMPEHWGGYLLVPIEFEFWQGRRSRLHDRIRYTLQDDLDWKIERLAP